MDTANNTYVEAANARAVDGSTNMVDIWYAKNSKSGATSLTITPNPAGNSGVAEIWEFSGVDTVSPLDQVAVLNSQPASSTPSGPAITTSAPVEAVVTVIAPEWWINGIGSGNSFTQDFILNYTGSFYYSSGWAHLITSSAGTYSAAWSTGLDLYTSTTASFKASSSYGACDLNQDGAVNVVDVQLATDMALTPANCTAPFGQCNAGFANAVLADAMNGACILPVLGVAPTGISFGNVTVGNNNTQTATLSGTGSSSTTVTQAIVTGTGFSISGLSLPLTLAVGQTSNLNVTFTPPTAGAVNGNIAFVSTALDTPLNLPLSGTGVTGGVSHSAALSWTPSTSANIASYNIYRVTSTSSTAPATPYPMLTSATATSVCSPAANPTSCAYTDTNVVAGTSYWYYAAAVDTGNNVSAPSNIVRAIIPTP
jgi:hypothetical protein